MSARRELEELLENAIERQATPGAQAVVASAAPDGARLSVWAGELSYFEGAPEVTEESVYDLASLTKILSTTLLCAYAVAEGRLDLDETPWPAWPGVSVRHALRHDGGLLWWAPFFESAVGGAQVGMPAGYRAIVDAVHGTPPEAAPGERTVYSDLGFIALGALLEGRLGERLDRVFDDVAARAFGETGLCFVPLYERGYHPALPDVACTERCPWRGRVVQGQVHDDNCFAMGGVAGHAGLFGTARDVEAAGRFFVRALRGDDTTSLALTLRAFAEAEGERPLGFDRATEGGSTGGAMSARARGHLGFTGTSLWVDPEGDGGNGAIYVLLTNRVCESRDNEAIKKIRPAFHRAASSFLAAG
jgi:CubicO group peptidase (beta-lactamase class C family)